MLAGEKHAHLVQNRVNRIMTLNNYFTKHRGIVLFTYLVNIIKIMIALVVKVEYEITIISTQFFFKVHD